MWGGVTLWDEFERCLYRPARSGEGGLQKDSVWPCDRLEFWKTSSCGISCQDLTDKDLLLALVSKRTEKNYSYLRSCHGNQNARQGGNSKWETS